MGEEKKIEELIVEVSPYYKEKEKKNQDIAEEEHTLVYESSSETLEPIYYWLLDFMQKIAGQVEKITDNFTSSPGSGHFTDMMQKATSMQNQAMSILSTVNGIIKSILTIINDLREWQIQSAPYKNLNSNKKEIKEAARLSLKQRWLDNVDIKRGNTSIKAMALSGTNQPGFVMLIDAFMRADSIEEAKKLDINERVKRVLETRVAEYLEWEKRSGRELAKRYQIERTYLKSHIDSLKLYTKWSKPYLRAASQLGQASINSPELVTAFNTIIFELTLFGKKELDFNEAITDKELPESFKHKKLKREYYSCVVVDFHFRGIPQRIGPQGQHFAFGGQATVNFKSYALNEEEITKLKQKLDESDLNDSLNLVQGITEESLAEIKEDLDEFLSEEEEEKEIKSEDIDPFTALFAREKKTEYKEEKEKAPEKIKSDNYIEKAVRNLAVKNAKRTCFKLFDVYKKTHGMPSHPDPYEELFIPTED